MSAVLPTSGAFEGREHVLPVRVYYEDTDFTGVVYHASYLRFFERGRTEFLRAAGVEHAALLALPEPCAFAVTRMQIDFRQRGAGRRCAGGPHDLSQRHAASRIGVAPAHRCGTAS